MEEQNLETRLSVHEAVCAERWTETILRIKRLEAILIACAGGIILTLWQFFEKMK
jgi:hypothetical protein